MKALILAISFALAGAATTAGADTTSRHMDEFYGNQPVYQGEPSPENKDDYVPPETATRPPAPVAEPSDDRPVPEQDQDKQN
jgi:hypothetical protein